MHRNVASAVKGPRVEREEVQPWTAEEAGRFLAAVEGHRLSTLFSVGVALGLRKGELLALRWDDIDFETSTLRVQRNVQRLGKGVGLVVGSPKTQRSRRTVRLPKVSIASFGNIRHFKKLSGRQQEWPGWTLGWSLRRHGGTTIEPRNLNRVFDQLMEKAGVRRIRFHDLRHTCAALLLAHGVLPRAVMELLGHTQMSMTTDLYGHVMPTALRSAADAMDGVLGA